MCLAGFVKSFQIAKLFFYITTAYLEGLASEFPTLFASLSFCVSGRAVSDKNLAFSLNVNDMIFIRLTGSAAKIEISGHENKLALCSLCIKIDGLDKYFYQTNPPLVKVFLRSAMVRYTFVRLHSQKTN